MCTIITPTLKINMACVFPYTQKMQLHHCHVHQDYPPHCQATQNGIITQIVMTIILAYSIHLCFIEHISSNKHPEWDQQNNS